MDRRLAAILIADAAGYARRSHVVEEGSRLSALTCLSQCPTCGEFPATSAFGFSVAVELARTKQAGALLYTLSLRRSKAVSD